MNLHEIANSGSFGSGGKARDEAHEKAEQRQRIPAPKDMNRLYVEVGLGSPVASFGCDATDGKDYYIEADGYAVIGNSSTAGEDARAIAALWNAYLDGDLVWKEAE